MKKAYTMRNQGFLAQIREACPKLCQNSWRVQFAQKQRHRAWYRFQENLKYAPAHFFFSGVWLADVMLDMLHILELISAPPCGCWLITWIRVQILTLRLAKPARPIPKAGRWLWTAKRVNYGFGSLLKPWLYPPQFQGLRPFQSRARILAEAMKVGNSHTVTVTEPLTSLKPCLAQHNDARHLEPSLPVKPRCRVVDLTLPTSLWPRLTWPHSA